MTLLEIALLGIRNFQQITRLELRPGLNFIQGANAGGKTTLRETILLSLFNYPPEAAQSLVHRQSASTCQAAITFKTQKGEAYRLAKDFIKEVGMLSKYDPSVKKFIPFEKRNENILRRLQELCGGLTGGEVAHYFSMDGSRLPSGTAGRPKLPAHESQPTLAATVAQPTLQTGTEWEGQGDLHAKQRRLQELKAASEKAEQAFELEEQLTDAQSRAGVLKRKLGRIGELDEELKKLRERIQAFEGLGTLEQMQELVEEFESKVVEKDLEHHDLQEDRALLEHQISFVPTDPIYRNKIFLAGSVVTVLSFGIGLVASLPGIYQHLYLVGLLSGLALMVLSVIMDMRWLSRRKLLEDKLGGKLKNLELLEARFKRENAKFFELLRKTDTDTVEAFKEKMNAYELLSGNMKRLLEERERATEGKDPGTLQAEHDEKTALIRDLEKRLHGFEGMPTDLPSLREEINILEKEVAAQIRFMPQADQRTQAEPNEPSALPSLPPATNGHVDPVRLLIQDPLIRREGQALEVARTVFGKLSLGSGYGLSLDDPGGPALVQAGTSATVPLAEMSRGTQDQVFLSLYLGWLLSIGSAYAFPVLLDDPLLALDERRQEMVLDILRDISQSRQVILLSSRPYPRREKEHHIKIP